MRVTRAYLAGLGAAGSLLAVAAIAFVLASVFVSFRGWPLGGDRFPPTVVLVKPPTSQNTAHRTIDAGRVPAAARLGSVSSGPTAPAGAGPSGKTLVVVSGQRGGSSGLIYGGVGPSDSAAPRPLSSLARPSTSPGSPCSGGCPREPAGGALGPVVQSATRQLGATVGTTGSNLGSAVRTLAAPVSRLLYPLSPPLSGVVSSTGDALGSTIGQTTQAAGGVLAGVGRVLGSALSPGAPS